MGNSELAVSGLYFRNVFIAANSRRVSVRQRNRQQSIVAMETGFQLDDAMYWLRDGIEV